MEIKKLWVGWLGLDTNIRIIAEEKPALIGQFPYCLITCIDSTVEIRKTTTAQNVVQDSSKECKFLGEGLLIPGSSIPDLIRDYNLFTGFDNIWCFREEPRTLPKPNLSLVGPTGVGEKLAEEVKEPEKLKELMDNFERENFELREWMGASGCVLGLGDGCGLTYATVSEELADELEKNWGNRL
jgi:hypothetical protein